MSSRCPARLTSTPGCRGASNRPSTATSTWSATVRPKRAIHAFGMAPLLRMVPTASPSAMRAPTGFASSSVSVSDPSSCSSASTGTETVCSVSPGAKVSVPAVCA